MKVRLTPAALDDLASLRLYLEDAGSLHTDAVIGRLVAGCGKLGQLSNRGARWRLSSGRVVWRVLVDRHFVFYEITADAVNVLRILHAHRDLRDIFNLDETDGF